MHDLSFKTGVKNIDVWREQDHFAGTSPGDSRAFTAHLEKKDSACQCSSAHLGHTVSSMGMMKWEK